MVSFVLTLLELVRGVRHSLRDSEFRALLFLLLGQLALGTLFYRQVERWSTLDALYFSVVTLATVGYGDLTPDTAAGKIFTMFYVVLGIGLLVAFANKLVGTLLAQRYARLDKRQRGSGHEADPPGPADA